MGLIDFFRRKPAITTVPALADFLDSRAAFIVQKCLFEYARARSGLLSPKLFKEVPFREAMERARWQNYPLCLRHVAVMVEHALRGPADDRAADMREGLIMAVGEVCGRYPVPAAFEASFWTESRNRIEQRIRQAGLAAPHAIKDLPKETASEFFNALPMHADVRSHDFELITNNLRANLCRAYEDFIADADLPSVAAALAAAGVGNAVAAAAADGA